MNLFYQLQHVYSHIYMMYMQILLQSTKSLPYSLHIQVAEVGSHVNLGLFNFAMEDHLNLVKWPQ